MIGPPRPYNSALKKSFQKNTYHLIVKDCLLEALCSLFLFEKCAIKFLGKKILKQGW